MILFKYLKLHNFQAFEDVTLNLSKRRLVLVEGRCIGNDSFESNGAGKSSLLEGLAWVLYGKLVRASSKSIDQILRKESDFCSGEVSWEYDNDTYQVIRYHNHPKHKNSVFVFRNGIDNSAPLKASTQGVIDQFLGMPHEVFIHTVFFGHNTARLTQATDAQKKQILDKVLGLEFLVDAQSKLVEKIHDWEDKWKEVVKNISEAELTRDTTKSQLESLTSQKESYELRRTSRLIGVEKQITSARERIKELTEALSTKDVTLASIAEKEKILDDTEEVVDQLKDIDSKLTDIGWKLRESKSEQQNLLTSKRAIEKQIEKLQPGDLCSHCEQHITQDVIETFAGRRKEDLAQLDKQINEVTESLDKDSKTQVTLLNKKKKLDAIIEQRQTLLKVVKTLKQSLSSFDSQSNEKLRLQGQLTLYENQYKEIELEICELDNPIQQANNKLTEITQTLQTYYQSKDNLQEEREYLKFWETGFGNKGIRSFILDSALPTLNEKAQYYSNRLTNGQVKIKFDTEKELKDGSTKDEFTISIDIVNGAPSYETASEGQKRRIDLCIAWAFQHLVATRGTKPVGLCVFDEVFDTLDSFGIEKVVEILKELSETKESIFCITHENSLKDYFSDRIIVSRENMISTISEAHESLVI